MSTAYIVATPIGNLQDITYRALSIFRKVDYIFCEDTRKTGFLLKKYGIKAKLRRHDNYNETASAQGIVDLLDKGKDIALVSDGGTPLISDPGFELVRLVRQDSEHKVIPIPGPSAVAAFLSAVGMSSLPYTFVGFVSKKTPLKDTKDIIELGHTVIFFESPKRVKQTIEKFAKAYPNAQIGIGREMTKKHEQYILGEANEIVRKLGEEIPLKGEFTVGVRVVE
jgi:16S rRNA (cytidine1402-2'-O)-methyltransferase